jgi:hypothetical protein
MKSTLRTDDHLETRDELVKLVEYGPLALASRRSPAWMGDREMKGVGRSVDFPADISAPPRAVFVQVWRNVTGNALGVASEEPGVEGPVAVMERDEHSAGRTRFTTPDPGASWW